MKKLIALVLALVCVLGLVGCTSKTYELPHDKFCYSANSTQTYELPHDKFCYSANSTQTYELNADDRQYIIDLLNSASWVNDLTNCGSDFVFYTQKQEVRYHSECGTFNDYMSKNSTTVSEEQRDTINAMLGIN